MQNTRVWRLPFRPCIIQRVRDDFLFSSNSQGLCRSRLLIQVPHGNCEVAARFAQLIRDNLK